ncbi:MAG: aconitate hydratase AcnA [Verrucomicrobia bacterium]|nr:aconitate hydratase AcnA [Verrucomicrobiota bacterium]
MHNLFNSLQIFDDGSGRKGHYYSLPALERAGLATISRLPVSIRIVLESVLRNVDGQKVTERDVRALAAWNAKSPAAEEIPFVVARVLLQDFTGVPLLVDLAAMRSAVARLGKDPNIVEPLVPVDLVIDHSVQTDFSGSPDALEKNLAMEFQRNRERYQFLKWGQQAFKTFKVIPPSIGIIHQVNLEYLAKGVLRSPTSHLPSTIYYPDTLVGTDSHTTMINGIGIVAWGVGGIEAEAAMLGQPVYFLTPEVVGVHLTGALREGVTATDLALHITQMLRKAKVVGKFVEYYGPGAAALSVADRATVANMSPEYGATMGFFPVDAETIAFMRATGRTDAECAAFENYFKAQQMFGMPRKGQIDYSVDLELDLAAVQPSVAGPKRPQDRIELHDLKGKFHEFLQTRGTTVPVVPVSERTSETLVPLDHGSVVIASITSCTNTSNPGVMLAAGLLAKKAVERGLRVPPHVKTSLAPGSRVVTDYLAKTGLQPYLDKLGFQVVGYGCLTCIGNSGPLPQPVEDAIAKNDLVTASVLSGNRNFEARVHQHVKANFLMSPPLVVAFALAGRVDIDLTREPIANGVYLRDIWPFAAEIRDAMASAIVPEMFRQLYADFAKLNPAWNDVPASVGNVYRWDAKSTYIQEPPFFENFTMQPGHIADIRGARALGIFGDSITTDHISPAGSIKEDSPAGKYLVANGVAPADFNSYGARRGNDRVMTRGTFANVRIKNLLAPGTEGGVTRYYKSEIRNPKSEMAEVMPIYDAAMEYQKRGTPLVIFAGQEYGTGSSRDWAAKGTRLLGVKAVLALSFERIHRSNLVGMGVLPCQLKEPLVLDGTETFDIVGLSDALKPRQELTLMINGKKRVPVLCRIDTPIEVEYYRHGGILPFVLRQLASRA